jgi:Ca2+-binding RTX toxin-like protein
MANLIGGSGNDSLTGFSGNDQIVANTGNDTVKAGDGQDTVFGGAGNDSLYGGMGYDQLYGDAGDDRLFGGNDIYEDFYGGSGNDTIYGGDAEEDWAWGGADQDLVYLGGGADLGYGGAGQDTVYGGAGNDAVTGASGHDSVFGDAGADRAYGGAGRDTLDGGTEHDTLGGGSGSDQVQGGTGNDLIFGDRDAYDALMDASVGPIDTTLAIANAAPFALDVYWIDTAGQPQFKGTVPPGSSFGAQTGSTHNWFVAQSGSTAPLEIIYGAVNQTVTFGPDFNDSLSGGDGDDTIHSDYGHDLIHGDAGNDSVVAGEGNDTAYGGTGHDSISLGAGNDSFGVWGGEAGNDTIDAGAGQDSVIAGGGDDVVHGGDGNDSLSGADGSDTLYGGGGADAFSITDDHQLDVIYGGETGSDFDTVNFANHISGQGVVVTFTGAEAGTYDFVGTAGAGSFAGIEVVSGTAFADTLDASQSGSASCLTSGDGADLLKGGAGADTLWFGVGDDTVFGGAGNDLIDDVAHAQQAGANLIDAGAGDDSVWSGDGDDTLDGGDGADALAGEGGDDWLRGDGGDDLAYGGAGNDTLQGGAGKDTLGGGAGNDRFQFLQAGGGDVVSDFDLALTDGQTADQLDVSDLINADGSAVRAWDVQVSDDGNGNAVLTFPQGESVVLQGLGPASVLSDGMLSAMGVPCFAQGTRIATPDGPRPVERIRAGDRVCTAQGVARVLWHGVRALDAGTLGDAPQLRPVRVAMGAIGNDRPLILSPQHGVCVPGVAGLIRARHLAELGQGARVARRMQAVRYHHLLLPSHALIRAEGAWVESFYPGPMALAGLRPADLVALAAVILAQSPGDSGSLAARYGPPVLPLLSRPAVVLALQARAHRRVCEGIT